MCLCGWLISSAVWSWRRCLWTVTGYLKLKFTLVFTGDSEVIMFSPCMFVCVCVCLCLSRCLSGRFHYEGLVPHKQYFAGTLLGMSSCASYFSGTHDVIDNVTRSQSRSNFEIDITPSIFELERRSKAQIVGNVNGCRSCIFNCLYKGKGGYFENFKYYTQVQFDLRYVKIVPNYAKKSIFHDDDVIDDLTGWPQSRPTIFLYKWNNNIFHDNVKPAKISSLNFLCIGIRRLWLHLYKCVFMTSLLTSPGHRVDQVLKLIYLRQYLS